MLYVVLPIHTPHDFRGWGRTSASTQILPPTHPPHTSPYRSTEDPGTPLVYELDGDLKPIASPLAVEPLKFLGRAEWGSWANSYWSIGRSGLHTNAIKGLVDQMMCMGWVPFFDKVGQSWRNHMFAHEPPENECEFLFGTFHSWSLILKFLEVAVGPHYPSFMLVHPDSLVDYTLSAIHFESRFSGSFIFLFFPQHLQHFCWVKLSSDIRYHRSKAFQSIILKCWYCICHVWPCLVDPTPAHPNPQGVGHTEPGAELPGSAATWEMPRRSRRLPRRWRTRPRWPDQHMGLSENVGLIPPMK